METLKIHRHTGRYNFKAWEIAEMKNAIPTRNMSEIAPRQKQINDMKEQIKTLQKHIDSLNDTTMQDSKKIEDGFENRTQDCYRLKNWNRRCYEFFAVESQILIQTLPFEKYDNQTEAFENGDLRELNTDEERAMYNRILYHDGKTYSFGPRIPDQPKQEEPATKQGTATLILTEGDIDHEKHLHFDPQSPSPVLFRNNLDIQDIIDAHEAPTDGLWSTFTAEWELTQPEIDAVMAWHWAKTAEGTDPNEAQDDASSQSTDDELADYPNLKRDDAGIVVLVRNGLKAQDVYNISQKDSKIWNKYVKTHGLTELEIENVGRFHDLPF